MLRRKWRGWLKKNENNKRKDERSNILFPYRAIFTQRYQEKKNCACIYHLNNNHFFFLIFFLYTLTPQQNEHQCILIYHVLHGIKWSFLYTPFGTQQETAHNDCMCSSFNTTPFNILWLVSLFSFTYTYTCIYCCTLLEVLKKKKNLLAFTRR